MEKKKLSMEDSFGQLLLSWFYSRLSRMLSNIMLNSKNDKYESADYRVIEKECIPPFLLPITWEGKTQRPYSYTYVRDLKA